MVEKIGVIGLGDMNKGDAIRYAKVGYTVYGCDLPGKRSQLEKELSGAGITVLDSGIEVSRKSDLVIYGVETENIEKAVAEYGPSTKTGAIVAGQTAPKIPEIRAFEKHLPDDVHIVTFHSLRGPSVSPEGQTMAVIKHRSTDEAYKRALEVYEKLGSSVIELISCEEHDRITADTQANTHVGFESIASAFKNDGFYPWENASYIGGIDNVKVLMALRIIGSKAHVYSGLAILNPYAKKQIQQYRKSVNDLFSLMIQEKGKEFKERVRRAGDFVFGNIERQVMLDDRVMGEFSLSAIPKGEGKPNSHLSLLGIVDSWHQLRINPYENLICETPPFKLLLGIVEYLFRNKELLKESIQTALSDKEIRAQDLGFNNAVQVWESIISNGDMEGYKNQFNETKGFFPEGKLIEAKQKSDDLIRRLAQK